jgi:hypothetical protein
MFNPHPYDEPRAVNKIKIDPTKDGKFDLQKDTG